MPRSSFSENPLLRVSRPVSACSRCRSAKVKCDGKLPACTACEKAGRESECSAANDQFARGKERSYVAALELRIEKLERRLAYARSRKASVAQHEQDVAPDADPDRRDSLATIKAAIHRNAARKRENSDINALVSDFGYLSVNATTRDFDQSRSKMTFARLVLAAATNDTLPEPEDNEILDLPSKQGAYNIVHYYMSNIYALFPAFSETTILSLLNDVYQEEPRSLRSTDAWLLWMVLAIGSTAQSQSKDDEFYQNGVTFVARAMNYADRALMPGYDTQIQSLLLLTQYSMFDPAHFDSWSLIGFTSRAVLDLGFHQDATLLSSSDKATQEARRKLFYCVYSLDRAISMVNALAFSFTDDSTSVSLPTSAKAVGKHGSGASITGPVSLDAALPMFQLRRKQSQWYQALIQSDPTVPLPDPTSFIWRMCHDMQAWNSALQNTLSLPIREMFDLELRYSYVYCISPSPRAPELTHYGRLLIFEHAVLYLDRIYTVAHAAMNAAFYTYHDVLRVYFMGTQFVAVLRDAGDMLLSGNAAAIQSMAMVSKPGQLHPPSLPQRFDHDTAGDNLERSLRCLDHVSSTLKKWGERWENALRLLENFEMISADVKGDLEARKEMRDSPRGHEHGQSQGTPQHIQQNYQFHSPPPNSHTSSPQAVHSSPQHLSAQPTPPQQYVPLPQQQPHEVRWVDVDVAQIIRGGGQI